MKIFLFIVGIVFLTICSTLYAQTADNPVGKQSASRLESVMSMKGSLMISESYDVDIVGGGLGSVEFQGVVLHQFAGDTAKYKGLKVQVKESGRVGKVSSSFIDIDELTESSKSVGNMIELANKWKDVSRESDTMVTYSTKGGFKIGFSQKYSNQKVFVFSGNGVAFFESEQLLLFKKAIDKGIALLDKL